MAVDFNDTRERTDTVDDIPDAPEVSFGSLYVFGTDIQKVRDAVINVYQQAGKNLQTWNSYDELESMALRISDLMMNPAPLNDDEVMILTGDAPGWIAVMSLNWEWAPPAQHPLAQSLSHYFEVLSITSVQGAHAEYSLYKQGGAVQSSFAGKNLPAITPGLPKLDLNWFTGKELAVPYEELGPFMADPERFLALTGPGLMGLRMAFEAAPIDDYPTDAYLVFR